MVLIVAVILVSDGDCSSGCSGRYCGAGVSVLVVVVVAIMAAEAVEVVEVMVVVLVISSSFR